MPCRLDAGQEPRRMAHRLVVCAVALSAAAAGSTQPPQLLDNATFLATLSRHDVAAVAFLGDSAAAQGFDAEWHAVAGLLARYGGQRERGWLAREGGVALYSVNCGTDDKVCALMAVDTVPAVILFRGGVAAKEYSHQMSAAVLAPWLQKEAAPPVQVVTGSQGLFTAVRAAAESGRAVAALLLPKPECHTKPVCG